jgi:hypothetical protein
LVGADHDLAERSAIAAIPGFVAWVPGWRTRPIVIATKARTRGGCRGSQPLIADSRVAQPDNKYKLRSKAASGKPLERGK